MGKKLRKNSKSKKIKRRPQPKQLPSLKRLAEMEQVATVFHDDSMLEICRTRWQHGEWRALMSLSFDEIRHDQERGILAAMIASVHSAHGNADQAKEFFSAAMRWKCDRSIAARLMISAVLNTIGRANTLLGDEKEAKDAYVSAIKVVEPRADINLLSDMRRIRETVNLGLNKEASKLISEQILNAQSNPDEQATSMPLITSTLDMLEQRLEGVTEQMNAQPDLQQRLLSPNARIQKAQPKVVVVATPPYSGGAWVYNAARIFLEQSGVKTHAAWVKNYRRDAEENCPIHLVKLHKKGDLDFQYDVLITSKRDLLETINVEIQIDAEIRDEETILDRARYLRNLGKHWLEHSDLAIDFDQIEKRPASVVLEIANALDIPCDMAHAHQVAEKALALHKPDGGEGFAPQPGARPETGSDGAEKAMLAEWVRNVLNDHDFDFKLADR